jgi:hypothetical protein
MGDIDKALDYVNMSLEHTPTLIELYTLKGKIFKASVAKNGVFFFFSSELVAFELIVGELFTNAARR